MELAAVEPVELRQLAPEVVELVAASLWVIFFCLLELLELSQLAQRAQVALEQRTGLLEGRVQLARTFLVLAEAVERPQEREEQLVQLAPSRHRL